MSIFLTTTKTANHLLVNRITIKNVIDNHNLSSLKTISIIDITFNSLTNHGLH